MVNYTRQIFLNRKFEIFASSGKNGEGCDANTVLTSEIKDSPVV